MCGLNMDKEKIRKNEKHEYSVKELRRLGIFKDDKGKKKTNNN